MLKSVKRFDSIAADETLTPTEMMESERNRVEVVACLAKIEVECPRIARDTLRRVYDSL